MSDLINRQQAIDALGEAPKYKPRIIKTYAEGRNDQWFDDVAKLTLMPSAQPEPHYCRECKWSRSHVNVDKQGKSEIYWRCLNWDGGTDEEGYCHEWEMRPE